MALCASFSCEQATSNRTFPTLLTTTQFMIRTTTQLQQVNKHIHFNSQRTHFHNFITNAHTLDSHDRRRLPQPAPSAAHNRSLSIRPNPAQISSEKHPAQNQNQTKKPTKQTRTNPQKTCPSFCCVSLSSPSSQTHPLGLLKSPHIDRMLSLVPLSVSFSTHSNPCHRGNAPHRLSRTPPSNFFHSPSPRTPDT